VDEPVELRYRETVLIPTAIKICSPGLPDILAAPVFVCRMGRSLEYTFSQDSGAVAERTIAWCLSHLGSDRFEVFDSSGVE